MIAQDTKPTVADIPQKWVDLYLEKTEDTSLPEEMPNLCVIEEFGFTSWLWRPSDKTIVSLMTAGDGQFWDAYYKMLAVALGAERMIMPTTRNPKAFCRKFDMRIAGYILEKRYGKSEQPSR